MESLQGPDVDAEAHPGKAGFQMYLFWVLLKLSSGNQEGPTGEAVDLCGNNTHCCQL